MNRISPNIISISLQLQIIRGDKFYSIFAYFIFLIYITLKFYFEIFLNPFLLEVENMQKILIYSVIINFEMIAGKILSEHICPLL